jgi:hypothetical protein
MGGNARGRHGLFRCGALVAARVRRPSILKIREPVISPRRKPARSTSSLSIGSRGDCVSRHASSGPLPFTAGLWDFCNALYFFESDHSPALIFCCNVAQAQ